MTLRATTHEQFRIVLRWVKEHPVLARNDNEVEKGGRELKNKLWEKLAIELNEIGPPIRTWMGWKRVLTDYKYSLKKKIQRRIANTSQGGSEILASLSDLETEALQASLLDWDFSDPEKMQLSDTPPVDDAQSLQKSPEDTSNPEFLQKTDSMSNQQINGNTESMDVVNHENLNGNEGPTMMPTIQDNLEFKMEISEFDDQNILNGKVQAQPTIPSPNSKSLPRGENYIQLQTVSAEDLTMNGECQVKHESEPQDMQQIPPQGQPNPPVSEGFTQSASMFTGNPETQSIMQTMMMSSNPPPKEYSEVLNASMMAQSPQFVQQSQPQQLQQLQQHQPQSQQMHTQQQQPPQQLNQQQQMTQQQMQQQQSQQPQQVQQTLLQQQLQSQQFQPPLQSQSPQQVMQQQSPTQAQPQVNQQQQSTPSQSTQQPPGQQQSQTSPEHTQSLTPEVMNTLIAREIDRMAIAHKARKSQQRKRETRDKTKTVQETPPPEQKPQKERSRKPAAETSDRNKRPPQKRPRPRPKETKDITKKVMRGREFRECLLKLLIEANEMEKRRIAITETKVRNQTEIQNLEITRMNLEIMKLQKEITLLDHGAKILP